MERRSLSPLTRDAIRVLGRSVRLERLGRGWTVAELAERVGVSRRTISKVEAGDPSVSVATVFEAAVLTGVPVFSRDREALRRMDADTSLRLAVLPETVRPRKLNDDF
ncbi:MAG: helix-turn-helix domain-containing protein [Solirubrobacterales bacterium]|nr:helix-turn-helix domain-containing protein [Solirubrobacterales bacterium]